MSEEKSPIINQIEMIQEQLSLLETRTLDLEDKLKPISKEPDLSPGKIESSEKKLPNNSPLTFTLQEFNIRIDRINCILFDIYKRLEI